MIATAVYGALLDPISQASNQTASVTVTPDQRLAGTPVTVTASLAFSPLILPQYMGITLFPQHISASATMVVEP
jgi:hypothetical protein